MTQPLSRLFFTKNFKKKIGDLMKIGVGGALVFAGINVYYQNEKFYDTWVMPLLLSLDPETAHTLAVKAARYQLVPAAKLKESSLLESCLFNLNFKTPIGLAAGFDKHGEAVEGLWKMGFGFVEVGSVTPKPQPGNPQPRVFRLTADSAIINRYGFNSEGHEAVLTRLRQLPPPGQRGGAILGINLGKNKTSDNHVMDYTLGVDRFGGLADYLVVNVSSPNTPGLRSLQNRYQLENLIEAVTTARNNLPGQHKPPLFIKIAPDLSLSDMQDIAAVALQGNVDGLIVSNTTVTRPSSLSSPEREEAGGLSGQPLKALSTHMVKEMYLLTQGKVPIIGVGGVTSGRDAYEKIRAGASLVQLYTGLVYHGPSLVTKITDELELLLRQDGFSCLRDAVGVDASTK